jgi:hypothetical protein
MILLWLAALAHQPAETPRQFIARVYDQYRHSDFSSLEHPERIFSPRLIAAIREDSRLSHGEVGALDGDPLCDCQDYGRLSARLVRLSQPTPRSATASVRVTLGPRDVRNLGLSLAQGVSGWRVADVVDPYGRSLLRALEKANREARGRH